ncbi:pyruvate decarboxylase [Cryptosporidium sp. chipmunk genotype I]|uniref:pyruvate decarboxylase n=1 Tax=Cryptosporidium sp. chipmunk genotype I TaxID=1280935 RepID=UPI00351A00F4|nr:pyruvate decarboxylase [Cryptosporidium sp. chipmunk genotype I]
MNSIIEGSSNEMVNVAEYLCIRLRELGCDHIFGVPGDYALSFLNVVMESEIKYIGTCNELNAGYAADAYARVKGIGALSTTFVVGELSAINATAGSFAEDVPVVHICSAPIAKHHKSGTLLHHTLFDYSKTLKMFEQVTASAVKVAEKETAAEIIDNTLLKCITLSKPVYICLCADLVNEYIKRPESPLKKPISRSNISELDLVMKKTIQLIKSAKQPVFILGYELLRVHSTESMNELLEISKIPFSTMIMGKTTIDEQHPQYMGIYLGKKGNPHVKQYVEESDCLIVLGEKMMDFNTGFFSEELPKHCMVYNHLGKSKIGEQEFKEVYVEDIIQRMINLYKTGELKQYNFPGSTPPYPQAMHLFTHRKNKGLGLEPARNLTINRMFDIVASSLPDSVNVLTETGISLFSGLELMLTKNSQFFGQCFFGSIGYSVGATLGLCIASKKRVFSFIGDGSLQVTVQDLSTVFRNCLNPIVIIINNDGYTIERVICDDNYNNIASWKYSKLAKTFGFPNIPSFVCKTEGEFNKSLKFALENPENACLIEVVFERWDCNIILKEMGKEMANNSQIIEHKKK